MKAAARLAVLSFLSALSLIATSARAAEGDWWSPDWLTKSPYSPSFEVRDTVNKSADMRTRPRPSPSAILSSFMVTSAVVWSRVQGH
jgi:hypothetical protein